MPCSICSDKIDANSKQRIVTLVDGFGSKHVIQISLLGNDDADVMIAAEMTAMNQRETSFVAKLQALNMGDDKIDEMRKKPGDCGCGGAS